jgi:predicted transcriptional regulator
MKPIDFRNATFEAVAGHLVADRLATYTALLVHGPATTRQLAGIMGRDILSVRPRVTELLQLGFVDLVEDPAADHRAREGTYRALPGSEARAGIEARIASARSPQLDLFA